MCMYMYLLLGSKNKLLPTAVGHLPATKPNFIFYAKNDKHLKSYYNSEVPPDKIKSTLGKNIFF